MPRSFPCSQQPLLPQMQLYVPWHGSSWGLIPPLASGHLPQFSPGTLVAGVTFWTGPQSPVHLLVEEEHVPWCSWAVINWEGSLGSRRSCSVMGVLLPQLPCPTRHCQPVGSATFPGHQPPSQPPPQALARAGPLGPQGWGSGAAGEGAAPAALYSATVPARSSSPEARACCGQDGCQLCLFLPPSAPATPFSDGRNTSRAAGNSTGVGGFCL